MKLSKNEVLSFDVLYPHEWPKVFELVKTLRPHLKLETFISLAQTSHEKDNYEVVTGTNAAEAVVGVMGYRVLYDLVHGKHLYIDDLVIAADFRSQGFGSQFLNFAESQAQSKQCQLLRLSTGTENNRAIQFYTRNQWVQRSVTFKKKVKHA
jgi:ribosomal protein S18 acetylase RimI-like enzyme